MLRKYIKIMLFSALRGLHFLWYRYFSDQWELCTADYYRNLVRTRAQHCGADTRIRGRITVSDYRFLTIGNNVHIGPDCYFRSEGGIVIGDNAHLSANITIYSDSHQYEGTRLPYDATSRKRPVIIERNVWIGRGVSIRPGVRIGEGAIIGIGTAVTRDVAPFEIVGAPHPSSIKQRDVDRYHRLDHDQLYGAVGGQPWRPSSWESIPRSIGDGSHVVFVCCAGRSGSQSIARVLDQHPDVSARHEPHLNLIRLSTEYAHGLKQEEDVKTELLALCHHASTIPAKGTVYVESDHKLSNLLPLLNDLFPRARFLWQLRHGRSVVASAFARGWFADEEYVPDSLGQYGKRPPHSEFRLRGDLADPTLDAAAWASMSAFERNCWYWAFWNRTIETALQSVDSDRQMLLRIEDLDSQLPLLQEWLGVRVLPLTVEQHHQAEGYEPRNPSAWDAAERQSFTRWCAPLMERYYPSPDDA